MSHCLNKSLAALEKLSAQKLLIPASESEKSWAVANGKWRSACWPPSEAEAFERWAMQPSLNTLRKPYTYRAKKSQDCWALPKSSSTCPEFRERPPLCRAEDTVKTPTSSQAATITPEMVKPQTIRVTIEMTPDQYAVYERAQSRARSQAGKHLSQGAAVARMAEALLDQGTASSRARHQVLIHTDGEGLAWYETERGLLPVNPDILEQARRVDKNTLTTDALSTPRDKPGTAQAVATQQPPTQNDVTNDARPANEKTELASDCTPSDGSTKNLSENLGRKTIPNKVLRAVFARARHRCERCGSSAGPLHVHHLDPVSDGGQTRLDRLKVVCAPCHDLLHEEDLARRTDWQQARARALKT